jgi:hypothetical protein
VEVGPVLAVNKVSRAAAEKKRERCFMVLIEWAVGEAIRRRLAHLYSATRHIKLKMVKNATKRSKSAVNRPPGLFLNRKSGGGIARSAPALLPRCTAVRRIGAPAYPPGIGPGRILLSRLSAVGQNVMAGLSVWSPLLPARPGKIFHRGSNFYLTRPRPKLECT